MLFVIVSWVIFFPIFCGLGLLVYAAFRQKPITLETFFLRFWSGYAVAIALLQIYHFFAPVNAVPFVLLTLTSAVGWLLNSHQIIRWLHGLRWWQIGITGAAAVPLSAWVANRCLRVPLTYDTPFYHWPNTIWNAKLPLVIGLANIHERFGFNSSHFLYTALIDIGPMAGKSMFSANGLLAIVLLLYILTSTSRLLSLPKKPQPYLFDGLLIPAVVSWVLGDFTGSYHPDWPVFAIGALTASAVMHWMFAEPDRDRDNFRLFDLSLLVSIGIAIKISFAPLGGCLWLLGIGLWVYRCGGLKAAVQAKRTWMLSIGCFSGILLTWMIRGILLSGYPAFPISLGGLPVPWKVPITRLYYQNAMIRGFARQVGLHWAEAIYGWDWFPDWFAYFSEGQVKVRIAIGSMLLIGLAISFFAKKQKPWHLIFLIPGLVGVSTWFISAPAVRFSGANFWVLFAGAVTLLYDEVQHLLPQKRFFAYLPLLILLPFANFIRVFSLNMQWFLPRWSLPQVEEYVLKNHYTEHLVDGITVYVADNWELCFNHPFPCTNHFNTGLRMREPGNIKQGFWVDLAKQKEMPPGVAGDLPLGSEMVAAGVYDQTQKVYLINNYFHMVLYSDRKTKVKATISFKEIKRNDQPVSAMDFIARVNGVNREVISMRPGQSVQVEIPLIEGANEFTFKENNSRINSETAENADVKILLDQIIFRSTD